MLQRGSVTSALASENNMPLHPRSSLCLFPLRLFLVCPLVRTNCQWLSPSPLQTSPQSAPSEPRLSAGTLTSTEPHSLRPAWRPRCAAPSVASCVFMTPRIAQNRNMARKNWWCKRFNMDKPLEKLLMLSWSRFSDVSMQKYILSVFFSRFLCNNMSVDVTFGVTNGQNVALWLDGGQDGKYFASH